jgi:hypothetical protein
MRKEAAVTDFKAILQNLFMGSGESYEALKRRLSSWQITILVLPKLIKLRLILNWRENFSRHSYSVCIWVHCARLILLG